ncbi:MAG: D-alanine--D-alanine ligase family protein [Patescibacteria group bacterium]|nr:D-alanine--D-alanine ligase family protein [Patescibacteria group bacterium]
MPVKKLKIGILFGGPSPEHEVSLVSAQSVVKALNKNKFTSIPIGLTKQGQWIIGQPFEDLKKGKIKKSQIVLPPTNFKHRGLLDAQSGKLIQKIDLFFPVLHGPFGEDGKIQGLLDLSGIPYVASGVLGSSLGMDKVVQKQIYREEGLKTPKFIYFRHFDWQKNKKNWLEKAFKEIAFPCFVKPANMGSSVGITKVSQKENLKKAIEKAFKYDHKVLVEKSIEKAREIETAILGNEDPKVSYPGEIIASGEFYDYDAKYVDGQSKTLTGIEIPKKVVNELKILAKKAFISLNGYGMARADFLVKDKEVYINEINTIPGFTAISMYPKLWQHEGISYSKLIEELISLAIKRHKKDQKLKLSYQPKNDWYK